MIGFGEAISSFYSQYANFSGRATRAEYWWVALYMAIVAIPLATVMVVSEMAHLKSLNTIVSVIYYLFCLANLIPGLALAWRRLHDIGRSGWWYFIGCIPVVGTIVLLVFFCTDSQPFPNEYGYPVQDPNYPQY